MFANMPSTTHTNIQARKTAGSLICVMSWPHITHTHTHLQKHLRYVPIFIKTSWTHHITVTWFSLTVVVTSLLRTWVSVSPCSYCRAKRCNIQCLLNSPSVNIGPTAGWIFNLVATMGPLRYNHSSEVSVFTPALTLILLYSVIVLIKLLMARTCAAATKGQSLFSGLDFTAAPKTYTH